MELSRRGFIKLSAGAAAAGGTLPGVGDPAAGPPAPPRAPPPPAPARTPPRPGVVPRARARVLALVHIGSIGLAGGLAPGGMLNIESASVEACAKPVAENPALAVGVRVRLPDPVVGRNGLEPLRRAIRAAEM